MVILDHPNGPSIIQGSLLSGQQEDKSKREKRQWERCPLKAERGAMILTRSLPLEAGKGKETDSPREPPGGTQACQHLDFSHLETDIGILTFTL